jgi:hypothetical protein
VTQNLQVHGRFLRTVVVMFLCGAPFACHDSETVWSAECRSPDGIWVAVARSVQYGGFGTDSTETVVVLKRTSGNLSERILGFSNDGKSMGLTMKWLTPSHLDVTFKDDPKTLYYQVVKTSGIEISARDLQIGPRNGAAQSP